MSDETGYAQRKCRECGERTMCSLCFDCRMTERGGWVCDGCKDSHDVERHPEPVAGWEPTFSVTSPADYGDFRVVWCGVGG